jgi:hypothetical protein
MTSQPLRSILSESVVYRTRSPLPPTHSLTQPSSPATAPSRARKRHRGEHSVRWRGRRHPLAAAATAATAATAAVRGGGDTTSGGTTLPRHTLRSLLCGRCQGHEIAVRRRRRQGARHRWDVVAAAKPAGGSPNRRSHLCPEGSCCCCRGGRRRRRRRRRRVVRGRRCRRRLRRALAQQHRVQLRGAGWILRLVDAVQRVQRASKQQRPASAVRAVPVRQRLPCRLVLVLMVLLGCSLGT